MKVILKNSSLVFQTIPSVDPTVNLWQVATEPPAGTGLEMVSGFDCCFIQVQPGQKYSIVFSLTGNTGNNRLFRIKNGVATQIDNITYQDAPKTVEYTVAEPQSAYDSLYFRFMAVNPSNPPAIYRLL